MSKFSYDQLKQITDVYYHASCPDGTASAFICAAAFKDAWITRPGIRGMLPKFWSIHYQTERFNKLEPRPGQLFVDITPPKEKWEEWKAVNPIVLDHHETVKHVTEGLGGVYATNESHSGAKLAYEEVMIPIIAAGSSEDYSADDFNCMAFWKELAEMSMIRDTWKKDSPDWDKACAIAMSMLFMGSRGLIERAQNFGMGCLRNQDEIDNLYTIGRQVVANDQRRVETLSKGAEKISTNTKFKMSFFNCGEKVISDTANNLIATGDNISVGYFYLYEDGDLRLQVSIRTDGSISAKKIAESLGGGGHERAAGFRASGNISPRELYLIISNKIIELYP
jgi:DHHA1 domain